MAHGADQMGIVTDDLGSLVPVEWIGQATVLKWLCFSLL